MDLIAFNWLVYSLTGSALQLAIANAVRAVPAIFFTLIGGVLSDRMERRKLLFSTQFTMMVFAFALAIMLSFGIENLWLLYAIAFGRGVATSFNQPARQALISELVPAEDLPNAVALNSATVNLSHVIGPAIGGILIATIGVTGAFYLNAFSFLAVLYGLLLMTFPPQEVKLRKRKSIIGDLGDGFSYLKREAGLRTLVILALVPMLLGQPYQTLLTVFAADVFESGSTGLGLMQSMAAVGAVAGALAVASSRASANFHKQMMTGLLVFGGGLVLFVLMPSMWLALPVLAAIGFSRQTYQTSNNTLIQMNVDPEYRGRVLSVLFLRRGLQPLGTVLAGVLAAEFGPRVAIGSMGAALAIMAIIAMPYALPALEKMRAGMQGEAVAGEDAKPPIRPATDNAAG
jgi:MFS transporter, DHA1 family, staphyloferrin A biosynthesis exporter